MNDKTPVNQPFILYTTVNGDIKLNVYLQDETIWLTQKLMAELFRVDVRTISEHLKNIFAGDELIENSVVRKFRITAAPKYLGYWLMYLKSPLGFASFVVNILLIYQISVLFSNEDTKPVPKPALQPA